MAAPIRTANGKWRIQLEIRGVRDSGTFASKREAQEWAARRAVEIRAMATGRAGTIKTLADAFALYAEAISPQKRGASWEQARLLAFAGHQAMPVGMLMADITPLHLIAWRDARLAVNSRGSVLRDMTLLGHVFEVARREWRWIDANPMKEVSRPVAAEHRERVISGPEVRRVLRQLGYGAPVRSVSNAVAHCFLLALFTGMRAGELCVIEWQDVRADHVRLHTSKTGDARDVPLSHGAARVIECMRGWDDQSVFSLKPQTLDALFRKARGKAGLAGFTFHDSRHTAATRLAQRLHVLDLCRMFGWRSTTRALTYYNPKAGDIAARLRG